MKSFAVIGLGRFGTSLALSIMEKGYEVLAIDKDENLVNKITDHVTVPACADACDIEVLKKIGVQDCDCAIVAIGTDLGVSAMVTMNLHELGIKQIVCKASNSDHKAILEKLGATRVVIPEKEFAEKLAGSLTSRNILEYIDLADDVGIDEIKVPSAWAGKRIGDINIRAKYDVNLIAIRNGDKMNVNITANTVLEPDSKLFLLGTNKALKKIDKRS